MNNVHEDTPVVFHTRWAMSYLAGPLARDRIKQLMDPVREEFAPPPATEPEKTEPEESKTEKVEEESTQTPAAEEPVAPDERAKVEKEYASKIEKASAREKKAKAYYREQFWQVPGRVFALGFRGIALAAAMIGGGATKRKSSSAMAAFERTMAELSQANTARGKWVTSRDARIQLEAEKAALLRGEPLPTVRAESSSSAVLIGVLLALAALLLLIVLGWGLVRFFGGGA